MKYLVVIISVFILNSCNKPVSKIKKTKIVKLSKELNLKYLKPLNGLWGSSRIIGKYPKDSVFSLWKIKLLKGGEMPYGNAIHVYDNGAYSDSYGASCGNDCFPSSNGRFEMISENKLRIFVEGFNQFGDCYKIDEEINDYIGVFRMDKISDTEIKLVRLKD